MQCLFWQLVLGLNWHFSFSPILAVANVFCFCLWGRQTDTPPRSVGSSNRGQSGLQSPALILSRKQAACLADFFLLLW